MQCRDCGMFISHKQLKSHATCRKHNRYVTQRINGGTKCPECQLHFTCPLWVHIEDPLHDENQERYLRYIHERKIAEYNLMALKSTHYEKLQNEMTDQVEKVGTHLIS